MKVNYLVLVRHGQSDWNRKNLFTGWKNPGLTDQGVSEAENTGEKLKEQGFNFDVMFTSELKRAQNTGEIILEKLNEPNLTTIKSVNLNERDYGDLTGMNKDEARSEFGEEQVHIWRRSYDVPPPGGESLKDTYDRVIPYFESDIMPELNDSKNVLIAAHGNSLRSLVKFIEDLNETDILKLEIATGEPIIYKFIDGRFTRA
jgi:2,3-bisphosphoglycerate-dependent phosphoglycerate mutase